MQRFMHDVPHSLDGTDPDYQVESFLKHLYEWLQTTRSLKQQQGMTILHYTTGDVRLVISELDVTTLAAMEGGEQVFKHLQKSYSEYSKKR